MHFELNWVKVKLFLSLYKNAFTKTCFSGKFTLISHNWHPSIGVCVCVCVCVCYILRQRKLLEKNYHYRIKFFQWNNSFHVFFLRSLIVSFVDIHSTLKNDASRFYLFPAIAKKLRNSKSTTLKMTVKRTATNWHIDVLDLYASRPKCKKRV